MKKTLLFFALLSCTMAFAQKQQRTGVSGHQVDKTLSGKLVSSNQVVNITFTDPKSQTNTNDDFDKLPVGELILMYQNLRDPIIYRVKYFGFFGGNKNYDWYGIVDGSTDYNCVILKMNTDKATKEYKYVITTVNMNPDTKNWITYTSYYCNID